MTETELQQGRSVRQARIEKNCAQLFALRQRATTAIALFDDAAEAAKAARANKEKAMADLYQFATDMETDQMRWLYDDAPASQDDAPIGNTPELEPADADAWRAVRLDSLKNPAAPPGALGLLAKADVETMGQLADYNEAHPNRGITAIKGIGNSAAEKVADACFAWHERNPQEDVDAPAPEPEQDVPVEPEDDADWDTTLDAITHGGTKRAESAIMAATNVDMLEEARLRLDDDNLIALVDMRIEELLSPDGSDGLDQVPNPEPNEEPIADLADMI